MGTFILCQSLLSTWGEKSASFSLHCLWVNRNVCVCACTDSRWIICQHRSWVVHAVPLLRLPLTSPLLTTVALCLTWSLTSLLITTGNTSTLRWIYISTVLKKRPEALAFCFASFRSVSETVRPLYEILTRLNVYSTLNLFSFQWVRIFLNLLNWSSGSIVLQTFWGSFKRLFGLWLFFFQCFFLFIYFVQCYNIFRRMCLLLINPPDSNL